MAAPARPARRGSFCPSPLRPSRASLLVPRALLRNCCASSHRSATAHNAITFPGTSTTPHRATSAAAAAPTMPIAGVAAVHAALPQHHCSVRWTPPSVLRRCSPHPASLLPAQTHRSLYRDPGLQQLAPYYVRFVVEQTTKQLRARPRPLNLLSSLQTMMRLVACLLHNSHMNIELYLERIMPTVFPRGWVGLGRRKNMDGGGTGGAGCTQAGGRANKRQAASCRLTQRSPPCCTRCCGCCR